MNKKTEKKFTILKKAESVLKLYTIIIEQFIYPIIAIVKIDPYKLLSTLKIKIKPLNDELLFIPPYAGHIGDMVYILNLSKPLMLERSLKMSIIVFDEKQFEVASLFKSDLKRIIRVDPGNLDYNFYRIQGLIYFIIFGSIKPGKINYICQIVPDSLAALMGDTVYNYFKRRLNIKNLEEKFSIPIVDYETRSLVYSKLEKMGFEKGKTIILNPYTSSGSFGTTDFWNNLVHELKKLKFKVITYVVGDQKPIYGTVGLNSTISEIIPIAEFSGTVINIRSGFSDLLQFAQCRIVNIYPSKYLYGLPKEKTYANFVSLLNNSSNHLDLILENGMYEVAIERILQFVQTQIVS